MRPKGVNRRIWWHTPRADRKATMPARTDRFEIRMAAFPALVCELPSKMPDGRTIRGGLILDID